jgi:hypothetical protein
LQRHRLERLRPFLAARNVNNTSDLLLLDEIQIDALRKRLGGDRVAKERLEMGLVDLQQLSMLHQEQGRRKDGLKQRKHLSRLILDSRQNTDRFDMRRRARDSVTLLSTARLVYEWYLQDSPRLCPKDYKTQLHQTFAQLKDVKIRVVISILRKLFGIEVQDRKRDLEVRKQLKRSGGNAVPKRYRFYILLVIEAVAHFASNASDDAAEAIRFERIVAEHARGEIEADAMDELEAMEVQRARAMVQQQQQQQQQEGQQQQQQGQQQHHHHQQQQQQGQEEEEQQRSIVAANDGESSTGRTHMALTGPTHMALTGPTHMALTVVSAAAVGGAPLAPLAGDSKSRTTHHCTTIADSKHWAALAAATGAAVLAEGRTLARKGTYQKLKECVYVST